MANIVQLGPDPRFDFSQAIENFSRGMAEGRRQRSIADQAEKAVAARAAEVQAAAERERLEDDRERGLALSERLRQDAVDAEDKLKAAKVEAAREEIIDARELEQEKLKELRSERRAARTRTAVLGEKLDFAKVDFNTRAERFLSNVEERFGPKRDVLGGEELTGPIDRELRFIVEDLGLAELDRDIKAGKGVDTDIGRFTRNLEKAREVFIQQNIPPRKKQTAAGLVDFFTGSEVTGIRLQEFLRNNDIIKRDLADVNRSLLSSFEPSFEGDKFVPVTEIEFIELLENKLLNLFEKAESGDRKERREAQEEIEFIMGLSTAMQSKRGRARIPFTRFKR